MAFSTIGTFQYIIDKLTERSIRHEVHSFDSGAKMLDIWYDNRFYVIQIDSDLSESIGFSEITEDNPGFGTIPDEVYYTSKDALDRFESIFVIRKNL